MCVRVFVPILVTCNTHTYTHIGARVHGLPTVRVCVYDMWLAVAFRTLHLIHSTLSNVICPRSWSIFVVVIETLSTNRFEPYYLRQFDWTLLTYLPIGEIEPIANRCAWSKALPILYHRKSYDNTGLDKAEFESNVWLLYSFFFLNSIFLCSYCLRNVKQENAFWCHPGAILSPLSAQFIIQQHYSGAKWLNQKYKWNTVPK